MTVFAVTRGAGPKWAEDKGTFDQPGANEHGAFMSGLAAAGVVVFAGPLDHGDQGRLRVLVIAQADSEADLRQCLADDPWERSRQLVTVNVERWTLLVGGESLPM